MSTATRTHRPGSTPIVLIIVGGILALLAPVVGVMIGAAGMIGPALSLGEDTHRIDGETTVDLGPDDTLILLAPVPQLGEVTAEDCTTSEGATIAFAPASELNTLVNGTRYESFATLSGEDSVTISCDTDVDVVAAPPFRTDEVFGPLMGFGTGGMVVAVIGVVLLIVGLAGLRGRKA